MIMLHSREQTKKWQRYWANPLRLCCVVAVILALTSGAAAQKKQLVQIKTFDEKLVPYKNVEVSINNNEYFQIGSKGVAFVELLDTDFPLKTIKIKDTKLEAASWNFGKGIIEVIIRTRSHQFVPVVVHNQNGSPLSRLKVTFRGSKTTSGTTDSNGHVDIPLALDETIASHSQFSIPGHRP